ncbi:sulfonate ABC transporter substrate-binding protein [Gloeobacter kilaueensis]|uniref:Putative aliphatic sulfonates-binding protein n=1 Tax=Gloeobacter kilaueensis (strain ATCC BAA-2537 / CCAP 1431/1 / ULC 316 / JS1) TaxID=1183438 RepID=U5QKW4_GLOK1|nr:sulfonate ABC transporter substrate-binding protein [Gloeobacter kilaueensis]AGY59566.1 aliphatic sulfonate ABC transporter periplasmic ligand-binding protein [Gloeobacter kilaueensis JS1]
MPNIQCGGFIGQVWAVLARSVLALGIALGLAGCSVQAGTQVAARSQGERVVRIGYQKTGEIIRLQGKLQKRLAAVGAKVEWAEFTAGPPLLEALSAGGLDFGATGDTPPIFAQAAGAPLVYVAATEPSPRGRAILVHKSSHIRTVRDLRGKKVAVQKASGAHYLLVQVLERAGLHWSDIKPVYLAPAEARVAFASHSVDAWAIWDPFYAVAEEQPDVRVLIDGEGITTQGSRYLASRDFALRNPDLLRVVLDEYRQVNRWIDEHPHEAALLAARSQGLPVSTLERTFRRRREALVPLDAHFVSEQQKVADTFWRLKLLPRPVNIREALLDSKQYAASAGSP